MQTCYEAYQRVIGAYSTIWKWNAFVLSKINNVRLKTHRWSKSDSSALKNIWHKYKQETVIFLFISEKQVKITLLVKKLFKRSDKNFARIKTRNVGISVNFNAKVLVSLPNGL